MHPSARSANYVLLAFLLAAPAAGWANQSDRTDTVNAVQALELPPKELARAAFSGLSNQVRDVWRPGRHARTLGLSHLAFAGSPFPSGFTGLCAVDRWDLDFAVAPGAIVGPPASRATVPVQASDLEVIRLYKVVGPISGAYALDGAHRALIQTCLMAGTAKGFFAVQGERDMVIEGLAAVSAALQDRKNSEGEDADWVCVDSRKKDESCARDERMHILNLSSISYLKIDHCAPYSADYCLEVFFAPQGNDDGSGAELKMGGVIFTRPDRQFLGRKVNATFRSAAFRRRLGVYD
jgi:hypothetical protein